MANLAEMDMVIESAPSLLAVEALRTFPIVPYDGRFRFLANGIQEPKWARDDEEKKENDRKYIATCLEAKVIPFSGVSMDYVEKEKLFAPKAYDSGPLTSCREDSINALLEGGKIHKIFLETSRHNEGFGVFRGNFLQTLIDKGYVLDDVNLCLTMRYHNPDSTFKFNVDEKRKGLILHLGSNISEEDTGKLENWFKSLRTYDGQDNS